MTQVGTRDIAQPEPEWCFLNFGNCGGGWSGDLLLGTVTIQLTMRRKISKYLKREEEPGMSAIDVCRLEYAISKPDGNWDGLLKWLEILCYYPLPADSDIAIIIKILYGWGVTE